MVACPADNPSAITFICRTTRGITEKRRGKSEPPWWERNITFMPELAVRYVQDVKTHTPVCAQP